MEKRWPPFGNRKDRPIASIDPKEIQPPWDPNAKASMRSLEPKKDETFLHLVEEALAGRLKVYFAAVPLCLCVPFDLDHRPDLDPIGKQAIEQTFQEFTSGNFANIIVYPRGKWFVVSDDYIPLFAALRGMPDYMACWVFGKPDNDLVVDVQGPIDAAGVRNILAFGT